MGIITGILGLPALVKEIKDLRDRVSSLEEDVEVLKAQVSNKITTLK